MKNVEWSVKGLGIILCLMLGIFLEPSLTVQFVFVGLILLSVGIPHGAIDHLLTSPKPHTQKSLMLFLIRYLGLIGIYLWVWITLPIIALIGFLLMSAYHFGQSHFLEEKSAKHSWINYLLRGAFFLSVILFGDLEMTQYILKPLIELNLNQSVGLGIASFIGFASLVAQKIEKKSLRKRDLFEIFILGPMLYQSPLLISFIVYFGFWHSLPSMILEFNFLKKSRRFEKLNHFIKLLLPFSLISISGIALILFFGVKFLENQELMLLFFILVSLISFPHILYMDKFIKKNN